MNLIRIPRHGVKKEFYRRLSYTLLKTDSHDPKGIDGFLRTKNSTFDMKFATDPTRVLGRMRQIVPERQKFIAMSKSF
jgi:hypothetical protein